MAYQHWRRFFIRTGKADMKNTVKLERARVNLSQQDMAEKVKVSRQTIHSIESGKFMPSYVLAIRISRVLKIPVEELFIMEDSD